MRIAKNRNSMLLRTAFSLVELLVVISILGILMSILLPSLRSSLSASRRTKCTYALHYIGNAYSHYLTRNPEKTVAATDWDRVLLPELDSDPAAITCSESQGGTAAVSLAVEVHHGGWPLQIIPCSAGPRCLVKNETKTSREYWIEDWNNFDYRDLQLLVEDQKDGSHKVSVILVDSSSTFDVLGGSTKLMSDIDKKNWRGKTCSYKGGSASYGMNNRSAYFTDRDGSKILLLDYTKPIANVVGADAADVFSAAVAARHGGLVNVLYVDGHVDSLEPNAIDPTDLAKHDQLWKPYRDPALSTR